MKNIQDFIDDYTITVSTFKSGSVYTNEIYLGDRVLIRKTKGKCSLKSILTDMWESGMSAELPPKQFAEDHIFMTNELQDAIKYSSLPTQVNADQEFARLVSNAIIRYNNLQNRQKEYLEFFGEDIYNYFLCQYAPEY